jgi:hypothetical protein
MRDAIGPTADGKTPSFDEGVVGRGRRRFNPMISRRTDEVAVDEAPATSPSAVLFSVTTPTATLKVDQSFRDQVHKKRARGKRSSTRQSVRLEAQKRYGEMDSVDIHVDILWLHT